MNEEKVLVFNPTGFILKMLFSFGMVFLVYFVSKDNSSTIADGFLDAVLFYSYIFFGMYFAATLFGFSLNATGNYFIAIILFVILLFLMMFALDYLSKFGKIVTNIVSVAFYAGVIWLPIRDIRKAIIYYKNTY